MSATSGRLRIWLGVFIILSALMFVYAYLQRLEADKQKVMSVAAQQIAERQMKLAEEQRRIAEEQAILAAKNAEEAKRVLQECESKRKK